jgi:hyperosmotically inducible protein
MTRIVGLLAIGLIFVVLNGCQTLTGETVGQNIDDTTLTSYVKTKLVADKAANLTRVDVDTTRGVVSLTGVVESEEQRKRAGQLAAQVDGVKRVINNLQVQGR